MTPAEFIAGFALIPIAVGAIVAAELWRPIMDDDAQAIRWADNTDRFPDDQRLRDAGWRIKDRPSDGPAIWEMRSINNEFIVSMTFEQALTTLGKLEDYKAVGRKHRR